MCYIVFLYFCTKFVTTMGIIIGIDVGISTTKIVGMVENGEIMSPIRIKATDPITSLYGAFGKYLYDNKIQLSFPRWCYCRCCTWIAGCSGEGS